MNRANGNGTVKFEGGFEYSGQLQDGKQNGLGTAKYPDGRTQTGFWKDGKLVKESGGGVGDAFAVKKFIFG
jgi:hypothetical protein